MIALSILLFSYLEHPILPIGLLHDQNQSGDSGFLKSNQPGGKIPSAHSLMQDHQRYLNATQTLLTVTSSWRPNIPNP